jgi:hypothetical protein
MKPDPNFSKIELYVIGLCFSALNILDFYCFFVPSIGVTYRGYMSRLTEPEEPPTEEYDPNYTEDLRDDLPGATSHLTS